MTNPNMSGAGGANAGGPGAPYPVYPVRSGRLIVAIRGPLMLIVLGVLLVADQLGAAGFDETWPTLLILFGLLKVAEYLIPDSGPDEPLPPPGGYYPPHAPPPPKSDGPGGGGRV